MPIHQIPQRPSLEFDRKAAKKLLREVRAGSAPALARFQEFHPRFRSSTTAHDLASLKLSDAQLVVARQYGKPSWPRYKHFIETLLLTTQQRADLVARDACSNDLAQAVEILEQDPAVARAHFYVACVCGEADFVAKQLAVDPGWATRSGGPNNWSPLLYACFSRFLRKGGEQARRIVEVARQLVQAGADPNSHFFEDHDGHRMGQTCLYGAAGIANHPELTRLLLDAGADVDERVPEPAHEVLYHVAEFKDVTCLRMILEAKPDPSFVSYCLGRALNFDSEAALVFLEYGADPKVRSPYQPGTTRLHQATKQPLPARTIRRLLECGADPNELDDQGSSAYAVALRRGYNQLAQLMEEFGADAKLVSSEDRVLGALSRGERTPEPGDPQPEGDALCRAARRGDVAEVKRLLAAGADVDARTDNPPLHSAGYAGQLEVARLLLDHGASLTIVNDYGGTPLGATLYGSLDCCDPLGGPGTLLPEEIPGAHAAIVELLLERGAELPTRVWGSEAAQDVLRRYGVTEGEE
jgi:ankyrin repeat protein